MKRRLFKRRTRLKIKIRFSVNLDQILTLCHPGGVLRARFTIVG